MILILIMFILPKNVSHSFSSQRCTFSCQVNRFLNTFSSLLLMYYVDCLNKLTTKI